MSTTKMKALLYIGVAFVFAMATFALAFWGCNETLFYSMCWSLVGAGYTAILARTILHLVMKDYSAEMWQISIYLTVAVSAWIGAILSLTWGWTSFWIAVMIAALIFAVGNRFIANAMQLVTTMEVNSDGFVQEPILEKLKATQRYEFVDDKLGSASNLDKPLCLIAGKALTVNEAEAAGYGAIAAEAIEYFKMLINQEDT